MKDLYMDALKKSKKVFDHKVKSMKEEMSVFNILSDSKMPDIYGNGDIIVDFQNVVAKDLGKDSAVFYPSGTMARQIALRIWCDKKNIKK